MMTVHARRFVRHVALPLILTALAVGLSGCGSTGAAGGKNAMLNKVGMAGNKTHPASVDLLDVALKIVGSGNGLAPNTYKPMISAQVVGGHVVLTFTKGEMDAVNFYWRTKGESAWKFLSRDTDSPYNDHTPPTTPGSSEVREYQAYGVVKDRQVGQPSDIVGVTLER